MKCKRQPAFLNDKSVKISDLWEVRLRSDQWQSITTLARARRCTYSQITRYCIFRLLRMQNLRWLPLLQSARSVVKIGKGDKCHRHLVCFYGEDAIEMQLVALRLRVSVSELIRIAIYLCLPRLALDFHSRKSVSRQEFFWGGIKKWLAIPHKPHYLHRHPLCHQFLFQSFLPWQWWNVPAEAQSAAA
jgi:hypothetical protein